MKAVKQHLDSIKEFQKIIDRTDNPYIIKDYSKAIRRLKRELRTYCKYKGFDYNKVLKN